MEEWRRRRSTPDILWRAAINTAIYRVHNAISSTCRVSSLEVAVPSRKGQMFHFPIL